MMPTLVPDTLQETVTDAAIEAFMATSQSDMFIGVVFGPKSKVYTYIGLPGVEVGSWVLVPGNSFNPEPHEAKVVTLNPDVAPGVAIVRIVAVLS